MTSHLSISRHLKGNVYGSNCVIRTNRYKELRLNPPLYHCTDASDQRNPNPPLEWYKQAFPRLTKLTQILNSVNDDSSITDERLRYRFHKFKALSRIFLGAQSVLEEVNKNILAVMTDRKCAESVCFSKPNEREPVFVDSLTTVCNFLGVSAQQRKVVRFTICAQVTKHEIWIGALEEILKDLQIEIESSKDLSQSKSVNMAKQIVSTCLKFLAEAVNCSDEDTSSWMRPKPKRVADSSSSQKWGEVLDMFNDLIEYLRNEERLAFYVSKLEVMKEGLFQIKDVSIDRNIGYREVQYQQSLVQKKLSKTLGHSSRCLFTLLSYYLHGTIRDLEVEVCGGLYHLGEDRICLYMGKFLTSNEERMVWRGVKQLDRALGLYKFVWESAQMKGTLELQGHLLCVGAEHKTLMYRNNMFFLHGFSV